MLCFLGNHTNKVYNDPSYTRRTLASSRPQRLPTRHLFSSVAMAGPSQERTQTPAHMRIPVRSQTRQRMREPLSLSASDLTRLRPHRTNTERSSLLGPRLTVHVGPDVALDRLEWALVRSAPAAAPFRF